jgi:hypothetical protein
MSSEDRSAAGLSLGQVDNRALDRLTAAFLRLLSEHWVQSEKLENLTQLLGRQKLFDPEELEQIGRETETDHDRDRRAADFVRRILDPLREATDERS